MVCPVCGGIHRWKQRDAWVESSDQTKKHHHQRRTNDAGAARKSVNCFMREAFRSLSKIFVGSVSTSYRMLLLAPCWRAA